MALTSQRPFQETRMIKYQNGQLYCECQLVAIWNACRFWGLGGVPVPGTSEYRDACEEAHAICGGVIGVNKQIQKYHLVAEPGFYKLAWVRSHLPVEFSVFCHRGYHAILAVAVRNKWVLVANYAQNRSHWIGWTKLKKIANKRVLPIQFRPDRRYKAHGPDGSIDAGFFGRR